MGYRSSRDRPIPSTVEGCLHLYQVTELSSLAKAAGLRCPSRKLDLVSALSALMRGDSLRHVVGQLTELEKNAVSEVVHSMGTELEESSFAAKYGTVPLLLPKGRYERDRSGGPEGTGLLPLFFYMGEMPTALKEEIRSYVPEPRPAEIAVTKELPREEKLPCPRWARHDKEGRDQSQHVPLSVQETTRAALHDVHAILRLVDAGQVSVSEKTQRVSLAGARAVSSVLYSGDFLSVVEMTSASETLRPFAWPLMIQAAKLARRKGTLLKLSSEGRQAMSGPPHQVIRTLFESWLQTDILDEFNRIDEVKGQSGRGKRSLTGASMRRDSIVAALAECPAGEWLQLDEFFRFVRASGNDFKVTENPWSLYISELHYGSLGYDGYHDWVMVEGRYAMVFLWEYLATLGLIDVAFIPPEGARQDFHTNWGTDDLRCLSRYDGLRYIRLNALGAFVLDLSKEFEAPAIESRPSLAVMPNLEIAVTGEAELLPSDFLLLSRFAEKVSDRLWRLTGPGILSAVELGLNVNEMREFLSARNRGELPETVLRLFSDVEERMKRISYHGTCHLLEVADSALALLIANDTRTRSYCFLCGEKRLVVPSHHLSAFRRGLRDLGYPFPPGSVN
ncbi:MAG: helicase-associated domain-containing protein [Planctomycetes bacterium]|nr:helicase-associated domain-containing protein [Planctomycetota bacterium]